LGIHLHEAAGLKIKLSKIKVVIIINTNFGVFRQKNNTGKSVA